jgi:hypothetical protein
MASNISKIALPFIGVFLTITGCTESGQVAHASDGWPDAECRRLGLDYQLDPHISIDAALKVFHNQVLPQAKASGHNFPAYYNWMVAVTEAVRRHELTDGGEASDLAQGELAPFIPQISPEIRDLETRAALREQTQFREMAKNITKRMHCQTDDRRSAAIDHLWSTYALPR